MLNHRCNEVLTIVNIEAMLNVLSTNMEEFFKKSIFIPHLDEFIMALNE